MQPDIYFCTVVVQKLYSTIFNKLDIRFIPHIVWRIKSFKFKEKIVQLYTCFSKSCTLNCIVKIVAKSARKPYSKPFFGGVQVDVGNWWSGPELILYSQKLLFILTKQENKVTVLSIRINSTASWIPSHQIFAKIEPNT